MRRMLVVAVALVVALGIAPLPACAEDATGAAGWRIYRDPATDQTTAPPPGTLPAAAERATVTDLPALQEQIAPGGTAAFVDLRGRFRAAVRAERTGNGVQLHCAQPATTPR